MPFHFKQFSVHQDQTTQKVGTDSLLLACVVPLSEIKNVLDIGTGCGIITLVCAQRNPSLEILALEPNTEAADEALLNFEQSPWSNRITLIKNRLQEYPPSKTFDLIITNPPYYAPEAYSKSVRTKNHNARYQIELTFNELLDHSISHMHKNSMLYLVLPTKEAIQFIGLANQKKLHLNHQVLIQPHPKKEVNRMIIGFSYQYKKMETAKIVIREQHKNILTYTKRYKELLAEFLLFL